MDKQRNGLLELYRFIICFWPLYHHNYFFFERDYGIFTVAPLAVDFFFVLSGLFLIKSMEKQRDGNILLGAGKIMYRRVKPMLFTLVFIASFSLVCVLLFIRENYLEVIFDIFKYWWFVLYVTLGVGVFYIIYRLIKNQKSFPVILIILTMVMCILHYQTEIMGHLPYPLTYVFKTFGCISVGMLISYIPILKFKKINYNIPIAIVLAVGILILAYGEKTYGIRILMIAMFGLLVYFSRGINVGGAVFDFLGKLSVRMYLYMAFITTIGYMGLEGHRKLFVLNLAIALIDVILTEYKNKCNQLEKTKDEKVSVSKK